VPAQHHAPPDLVIPLASYAWLQIANQFRVLCQLLLIEMMRLFLLNLPVAKLDEALLLNLSMQCRNV
jgi:hypothetical protein